MTHMYNKLRNNLMKKITKFKNKLNVYKKYKINLN